MHTLMIVYIHTLDIHAYQARERKREREREGGEGGREGGKGGERVAALR